MVYFIPDCPLHAAQACFCCLDSFITHAALEHIEDEMHPIHSAILDWQTTA